MSTARRKVRWMVALVVLSLVVSGCSGIKPYEPRDHREEGPEKGLFSGSQGEFVIYRKAEEPKKESEDTKDPGDQERAAPPEPTGDESGSIDEPAADTP